MNNHLLLLIFTLINSFSFSQTPAFERGPDVTGNIDFIRPVYADSNRVFCFVKAKNGEAFLQKYLTKDFSYLEEVHLPVNFGIQNKNEKNVQVYSGKGHGVERLLGEPKYLFPGYFLQQFTESNEKYTDQHFYIVSTVHGADTINTVSFRNKEVMNSCADIKNEKFILFSTETKKIKRNDWLILETLLFDKRMNQITKVRDSIACPDNAAYLFRNSICDSKGDFWFLASANSVKSEYMQIIFHFSTGENKLTHHTVKTNDKFSNAFLFENTKNNICFTGTKTETIKRIVKFRVLTKLETVELNPDLSVAGKNTIDIAESIKKMYPDRGEGEYPFWLPADFRFHSFNRFTDNTLTFVYESSGSSQSSSEGNYNYTRYCSSVWVVTLDNDGNLIRMSLAPKMQTNTITTTYEDHSLRLFGGFLLWTSKHTYGNKIIEDFFSHHLIQKNGKDFIIFNDHRFNINYDPYSTDLKTNQFYPMENFENLFLHVWEINEEMKHYALIDKENPTLIYTQSCLSTGNSIIGIFDDGKNMHWGKISLKE